MLARIAKAIAVTAEGNKPDGHRAGEDTPIFGD
jgi:hypothetical protein